MDFEDWAKNEGMFLNKNKGHYTDPETNRASYIWDACAEQNEENIKQAIEAHKPRWIPVSERLPDKMGYYPALKDNKSFWEYFNGGDFENYKVTHWLELPEIPK